VTDPAARRFYADLVGEIAPLFPGKIWHVGADEYLGIASTPADFALYPQLQAYAQARYGSAANGKDAVHRLHQRRRRSSQAMGKRLARLV
jgi:hexosaminidase